jgi:hypothetical protein
VLGGLLIVGSASYTVHRNAQRRKEAEEVASDKPAG